MKQTLDSAIGQRSNPKKGVAADGFLGACESKRYAPAYIESVESTLRALMASIGNLVVAGIGPNHIDQFFAAGLAKSWSPGTCNKRLSHLKVFAAWCRQSRLAPQHWDPTTHRRQMKGIPEERLRVPATEFPRLMDACTHPRDRMNVALGLFLFLRAGEICTLKIKDVELHHGEVDVVVHKTLQRDTMPICAELDTELRRYLTWFAEHFDPIGDMLLVPAKARPRLSYDHERGRGVCLDTGTSAPDPTKQQRVQSVTQCVQRALDVCGYSHIKEGGHTLRRSGARALFDRLEAEGYDGAIRKVQAMLHHSTIAMTERYLGIEADRQKRNTLLRGLPMFPTDAANVVPLRRAL